MELEIRRGQALDLAALKAVDSNYAAGHLKRGQEIEHWLAAGAAHVALREGKPCAYAALGDLFGRPFVHMLMVAKGSRGAGIGTQLLAYLEDLIEGPELWTSTNLSNQPMQRLLAARDYKLTGYIDNLDPGDPELFFFKRLG